MNILVTGGAGYIGSHTVRALAAAEGLTPVVFDNLSTGHAESVPEGVTLVEGDIHDIDFVAKTLETYKIDGVIHFAAYSLVGESMVDPAKYYTNNVEGTLHLLLGMQKAGVSKIVFSSTAAVYGEPEKTPIEEDFPHNPTNVYGRTKLVIEHMMRDFTNAYGLSYVALRYFNAAGAALDGTIGEDHNPESHLIPLILKTAQGCATTSQSTARTTRRQTELAFVTISMSWILRMHTYLPCSTSYGAAKAPISILAVKTASLSAISSTPPKK